MPNRLGKLETQDKHLPRSYLKLLVSLFRWHEVLSTYRERQMARWIRVSQFSWRLPKARNVLFRLSPTELPSGQATDKFDTSILPEKTIEQEMMRRRMDFDHSPTMKRKNSKMR